LGKRNEKKMYKKENKSGKKNTWGKLQCFKEKDKKTKISTSSIVKKKKKNKNNSEKKKKKKKI
jgi:hypothetical protein